VGRGVGPERLMSGVPLMALAMGNELATMAEGVSAAAAGQ
jgi:hypothetical protein